MANAVEVRELGTSGVAVTRLGLGTAPLGGLFAPVSESDGVATVRQAYARGLRYFDTAPVYGLGNAEQRLGWGLRELPRDSYVVSTKVGRLLRGDASEDDPRIDGSTSMWHGTDGGKPVFDFSYHGVRQSVSESLERLGLDRVDIALIHDPDDYYQEAGVGAYRALSDLRGAGIIRAVGVGMNQAGMLVDFARERRFDCFLVAGRYSLLDQSALGSLLPVCQQNGIGVIVGGVYNSGVLAEPTPQGMFDYQPVDSKTLAKVLEIKAVCDRYGVPLKAAAIQFPAAHEAVTTIVTGARSVEELHENIHMFEWEIPEELWVDLKRGRLLAEDAPV